MLSLKPGVRVLGLRPEILLFVMAAQAAYAKRGADLVITSGIEGTHSRGSEHYTGLAVDVRTSNLAPSQVTDVIAELKAALGPDFDILLEDDHLHAEWDPKDPY